MKYYLYAIGVALLGLAGTIYYFYGWDGLTHAATYEKPIEIVVEEKTNCTLPDKMKTEECVKRITDDLAENYVRVVEIEKEMAEVQKRYDEAFEDYQQSIFNANTLMK